ncbi:MAG: hypothetical protein IKD69_05910 [Solobacterium sp.]|nr:hypothetical protein [Solobacterium sp.]
MLKKLTAVLLVVLIVFAFYVYRQQQTLNDLAAVKDTLQTETAKLQDTLAEDNAALSAKDAEIAELAESKKDVMEDYEVWRQRTEKLQQLRPQR